MRRLLAVVTAATLFAGSAFAQTAQPVLIGQSTAPVQTQSSSGEDALAQFENPTGTFFNNPLVIAGIITVAIAVPIAIAISNNDNDTGSVSP